MKRIFKKFIVLVIMICSMSALTGCTNQGVLDWILSHQDGQTLIQLDEPLSGSFSFNLETQFELNGSQFDMPDSAFDFMRTALRDGLALEVFTIALNANALMQPEGSAVQVRELNGAGGRVIFNIGAVPEGQGNLYGTYVIDPDTNIVNFDVNFRGELFKSAFELTTVTLINQTLYFGAKLAERTVQDLETDAQKIARLTLEAANLAAVNTSLNEENASLANTITMVVNEKAALVEANQELESENGSLISANAALTTENGSLISANAALTTENGSLVSANAALTSENASCVSANTTLTSQNASLTSSIATLTSENASCISANTTLTSENASLASANTTLTSQNATLVSANTTLTSENASLENSIAQISGQLTEANTNLASSEAAATSLITNVFSFLDDGIDGLSLEIPSDTSSNGLQIFEDAIKNLNNGSLRNLSKLLGAQKSPKK